MASQVFRAGVVLVVRRPGSPEVMAFERVDVLGSWQLPQGGIRVGEEPVEAAWRELAEETALTADDVDLVDEHPEWTVYEWPPEIRDTDPDSPRDSARRGQALRWFFFVTRSPEVLPVPDGREFGAWQWVEPGWLVEHVVEFRRPPYRSVLGGAT